MRKIIVSMLICLMFFSCSNGTNDSVEKTLDTIKVAVEPDKTSYVEGEFFSTEGMVVKAIFSDGSEDEITDYDYTPKEALSVKDKYIIISYTYKNVTKKTAFEITVNKKIVDETKVLDSIAVSNPPNKTAYLDGESFDKKGMIVTAIFTDETSEEVDDYTVSPAKLTYTDESVLISYTYAGVTKTVVQSVSVKPVVKSISITKNPNKTEYSANELFSTEGMEVTAKYSNAETKVISDYTVLPSGKLSASDTFVTISYTENSTTVSTTVAITVVANTALYNINFDYITPKADYGEFSISGGTYEENSGIITLTSSVEKTEYILSGYFKGQIVNNTKGTILTLKNAYIENTTGQPAIISTKKLEISAKADTQNYIISTGTNIDKIGTVYCYDSAESKSKNLELGGKGVCYILGIYHGVKADEVKAKGSGTYYITGTSKGSAISCNTFLIEEDKTLTLCLGNCKNGIKADDSVSIASGTIWFENILTAIKTDTSADDSTVEHFINLSNCKIFVKNVETNFSTESGALNQTSVDVDVVE